MSKTHQRCSEYAAHYQDFDFLLSHCVSCQAAAAVRIRSMRESGAKYAPSLLSVCQATIDPLRAEVTKTEEILLGFGAMTLGDILGTVGYCEDNELHQRIVHWIVELVDSSNTVVAFYALNAIRLSKVKEPRTIDCLMRVIESDQRLDEHPSVTLRAVALRTLFQIGYSIPPSLQSSPAWHELSVAYDYWQQQDRSVADEVTWMHNFELR
ncbi:MAG: hypothetical protein U0930_08640 [Pirellulales bacterium]